MLALSVRALRQGARPVRARRGPAAAGRLGPDQRVRRRPADADPGQGPRADRPVALLVRRDRARSSPNHLLSDGSPADVPPARPGTRRRRDAARPDHDLPPRRRPAGRARRARLPRRLGLEGVPRAPAPSAASGCPPACARATGCPSRSSPRRRRPRSASTTSTSTSSRWSAAGDWAPRGDDWLGRRRGAGPRAVAVAIALYAAGRARCAAGHHPRRHEVRDGPGRRRADPRRRGAHAGFVALLGRGGVRARRPAGELRQAVRARLAGAARRGTGRRPGPELPADVVAGTRARYVEAFERITGASFERYLREDVIDRMDAMSEFRFAVNVLPEGGHPRSAGSRGGGQPGAPRGRGRVRRARRAAGRADGRGRRARPRRGRRSSASRASCSRNPLIESFAIEWVDIHARAAR